MELHVFDFDGTLFRSPLPPDWWKTKIRKTWWIHQDSLGRPCVPDKPDASWWVNSTVATAKQSIADPDVLAILCTGRSGTVGSFRYRVPELLSQRGLNFDKVYLNPEGSQTANYKKRVLLELLRRYPDIDTVQIWEDRSNHLTEFESFITQRGIRCVTHLVSEAPKEPLCGPETYDLPDPYAVDPQKTAGASMKPTASTRVSARWFTRQAVTAPIDEKMKVLLLKIRKGATASINLKKMLAVLDLLGGWKYEKVVGLTPLFFTEDDKAAPESLRGKGDSYFGDKEDVVQAHHKKLKALEVSSLPTSPRKGMAYTMDVEPVVKVKDSYAPWQFTYKMWVGSEGFKFTSPSGKTQVFLPGRFDFRGGSREDINTEPRWTPEYKVYPWLMKETEFLAQVNEALGMEEHVPAAQRTRENTGTCAACFVNVKLSPSGKLPRIVLHGYKRPGWGRTEGRCHGVDFPPFELSPKGTEYVRKLLKDHLADAQSYFHRLEKGEVDRITVQSPYGGVPKVYLKDDPKFEAVADNVKRRVQSEIESLKRDISHFDALIKAWRLRPLPKEGQPMVYDWLK